MVVEWSVKPVSFLNPLDCTEQRFQSESFWTLILCTAVGLLFFSPVCEIFADKIKCINFKTRCVWTLYIHVIHSGICCWGNTLLQYQTACVNKHHKVRYSHPKMWYALKKCLHKSLIWNSHIQQHKSSTLSLPPKCVFYVCVLIILQQQSNRLFNWT